MRNFLAVAGKVDVMSVCPLFVVYVKATVNMFGRFFIDMTLIVVEIFNHGDIYIFRTFKSLHKDGITVDKMIESRENTINIHSGKEFFAVKGKADLDWRWWRRAIEHRETVLVASRKDLVHFWLLVAFNLFRKSVSIFYKIALSRVGIFMSQSPLTNTHYSVSVRGQRGFLFL